MKIVFIVFLLVAVSVEAQVPLRAGMKINSSITVTKNLYQLSAANDVSSPVIEITGDSIVVDFNGALLKGDKESECTRI